MAIVDLYGHEDVRERLQRAFRAGSLPASLLLHGARGIGKQRLGLWLGQMLLCETPETAPCGTCRSCRYARDLTHPDLHWYFPRPRLKDADPDLADVREDYQDVIRERTGNGSLYSAAPGNEGIFVATVRAIVQEAASSPALAARKVFVIGDAERMGLQEGSEYAANAFLKMLEEPSAKTNIIVTSSEPGALLPTIRSRTVAVRIPLVSETAVHKFVSDPLVTKALGISGQKAIDEKVQLAAGAPGTLFGDDARAKAMAAARKILEAAASRQLSQRHLAAMSVGGAGARGSFTDILDAMIILLGERMRAALYDGNTQRALAVSRVSDLVGTARIKASGNVNPQLFVSSLLRELSTALR